jgi:glycosyltransferase involved in cell wall biosynthesis
MHVAFFNRSFYPDTSATGQLLTELCEGLVDTHGCRVSVVAGVPLTPVPGTRRYGLSILGRETYRGIDILRARGTRFSKRRFAGRFSNYGSYFLSACHAGLRLDRPDVVVAQTDPPIIGLAACLAARRVGAPFVMVYQDIFPEVGRLLEDFQSERVNRWLDRVNRALLRRAASVVAIGETMAKRLVELKGADSRKVTVIHNWADRAAVGLEPKRNRLAQELGLADRFVVLHSGNLGLSQGLETLLEAASLLRDLPDVLFAFQGDGVKRDALAARAQALGLDNVRFLPYAPRHHLRYMFGAADVQVVSLRRGLAGFIVPSKLYGILASGRPYVAAVEEDSEVADLTARYDSGLVVPPEAPEALAKAIVKLYEDPALRERLGANGLAASALHDRRVAVAAYHRLLTATAAAGHGARVPPALSRPVTR